jgi:hypothetical protein
MAGASSVTGRRAGGPAGLRPAQVSWPDPGFRSDRYCLATDRLRRALPATWRRVDEIGRYIDGLYTMQCADGTLPRGGHKCMSHVGGHLREIGREVGERYSRRAEAALAEVAGHLEAWEPGAPLAPITPEQCDSLLDGNIVVLCGTESTWSFRSTAPLLSMSVFELDQRETEAHQLQLADKRWLTNTYRDRLAQPDLSLGPIPRYLVGDLLYVAGVGRSHPVHFARFLPADLGGASVGAPEATVTFRNVYGTRFNRISGRLFTEQFGRRPRGSAGLQRDLLLAWFRGHDIGHFWRLPKASVGATQPSAPDHRWAGALAEAFSDVCGFLALDALADGDDTYRRIAVDVFLAEALRYARRNSLAFDDSAAAVLELSVLLDDGALRLTSDGVIIDEVAVADSLQCLGRRLLNRLHREAAGCDDDLNAVVQHDFAGPIERCQPLLLTTINVADDLSLCTPHPFIHHT